MKNNLNYKKNGFSLIETMAVVAITGFLAMGIIFSINQSKAISSLADAQTIVSRALEKAQNMALTGIGTKSHGVYIEEKKITIFEGPTYTAGTGEIFYLPPPASTGQNGTAIIFKRLAGTTDADSVITISSALSNSTKKITITASGSITPE